MELDILYVKPWQPDRAFGVNSGEEICWRLPPSKSHLIRWLLLGSQTQPPSRILDAGVGAGVILKGVAGAGRDVSAMKDCLQTLGVEIISIDVDTWQISGKGQHGFCQPGEPLNCLNSGTTLRLITGLCARIDGEVEIDGDSSLRKRANDALIPAISEAGVKIDFLQNANELPIKLTGPWEPKVFSLDLSASGQPLSALRLAVIGAPNPIKINLHGNRVSRKHILLSDKLARATGSLDRLDLPAIEGDAIVLHPWQPVIDEAVNIPGDASMLSFAMLFSALHGVGLRVEKWPERDDSLGNEILLDFAGELRVEILEEMGAGVVNIHPVKRTEDDNIPISACEVIDLTDANDLISPIAAMLAIGAGGSICGVSHAQWKESNRISKTIELLAAFSISATYVDGVMTVDGGQVPLPPAELVRTYLDHRLQMTAVILASKVGGKVQGRDLHEVSYFGLLDELQAIGIEISSP
jgi:3-phosphoshikimate 1-carboxyvinyltransferase